MIIDKKSLEDKFRIFKENAVTDISTKIVFPLAVKNLKLLHKVVGVLRKYNIYLLGLEDISLEDLKFGDINYRDIQWMCYKPKIEQNVYKKIYNNVKYRKSEKAKLISDRDLFLVKLEDNLLTKETKQFLNHIIEDLNKAIDENIETEYVLDTSNDVQMNNGFTKDMFNTGNKNNTNILDMSSHIQQVIDKNDEDLFDSQSLKDALKQIISYGSVDDGSTEKMLSEIKDLRGMISEQKRIRINKDFNKDIVDEIIHDIDHLQNMVNEGGIQPECDEVEEALVERVLPIVHPSEIDEDTSEFVKVLTSNPNNKNYDIFEDKNGTISFMTDSNMSEEDADELYTSLSQKINKQAESSSVRLYSSSVKDHFDALEDIDHWEKKDKE